MGEMIAMGSQAATAEKRAGGLRSPISWGLLGLVIQRPSYGYELVQRFERTYEDTLELSSPSQIYTALDALARRCMIERIHVDEDEASRQPKPHYRATAEGIQGYRDWLVDQLHQERRRSRLFARQLAMLAPGDALVVIEHCELACLAEAAMTVSPVTQDPGEGAGATLAERLVSEEQRLGVGARLDWIEYTRRQLAALATSHHAGTRPPARP